MAKSKVAKKFHLDSDGYLTTKPDRQLTTEEEATDAAEAAIEEALEEGGAIAEAIADSLMVVNITSSGMTFTADKTIDEIIDHIDNGGNVVAHYDESNGAKASVFVFHLQTFGRNYAMFAALRSKASDTSAKLFMLNIDANGVAYFVKTFTVSNV